MEYETISSFLARATGGIAKCVLLAIVLPLAAALLFAIPLPQTLGLIAATFVIEYGAAPVGVGLGLNPVFVFFVLTSIALGVTLALFDIFESVGDHSVRVRQFLDRCRKKAQASAILAKYGIYGLVPCVLTLGFYVCPPVAWVMGWDRTRSIALILSGYCAVSLVLVLATTGILSLIIPG